jgi:hypothetical protein
MADFHVLDMSVKKDKARVAFHVSVPVETNAAGKALSDAVVECFSPASEVEYLTQPEKDAVAAGTTYEHVEYVAFSGNATNGERLAIIQTQAAILQTKILERLRARLAFWGYEGTVT